MKSPNIIPADAAASISEPASTPLIALGRRLLLMRLRSLRDGEIRLKEDGRSHRFGHRTERCALSVCVTVDHPQFFADAAFGGSVGAGEAYINGYWRVDNLTDLVRIFAINHELIDGMDSGWARVSHPVLKLFHWFNRNTKAGSAKNIAAHYDLGNDLYRLILDETMAYSCGIFTSEEATLADASRAKFDSACKKLDLKPGDHLLEIGTGWGGLAIHAAQHYGCQVTTTTISREQHQYTQELVRKLGLQNRITLLLEDYRDLKGQFDKLVSVEMIEAVGAKYLDTYLAKCSSLLKHSGAMLLQSITLQDQFYRRALRSVDFIQRFVFPGSFIPSITAITGSLRRVTDLKVFHLEDIGPHYARTLALWRRNFFEHIAEVRRLGYPEPFIRLWEFYLGYCEGGFAERRLGDVQMLLTKPGCRRPAIALT